eukprot:CAMPEP_0172576394 /NCGR_PEP_ID=MMETSP1067-20121228/137701_1 /TAXON_ID=265564 ORGANISM="Thalassiosira punctigera, Strain Tpunct2005C2" /NCGR_SAMPLE_ID=MMETSP1067 /ASSEMBLY_ACC=CAM_ASM_000444 /LENGTH=147 /DNA_ID=CAMNT_0013369061 /DNA_START=1008 /DNA_END=1452 /DNA_ORIENTATION=-
MDDACGRWRLVGVGGGMSRAISQSSASARLIAAAQWHQLDGSGISFGGEGSALPPLPRRKHLRLAILTLSATPLSCCACLVGDASDSPPLASPRQQYLSALSPSTLPQHLHFDMLALSHSPPLISVTPPACCDCLGGDASTLSRSVR